jgi:hypothetical protein
MKYLESTYHAELRGDSCLHWSDGDVWTRTIAEVEEAPVVKLLPPWLAPTRRRRITREQDAATLNSKAEHEAKSIFSEIDQAVVVKQLPPWLVRNRKRVISGAQHAAVFNSTVEHEAKSSIRVRAQSINEEKLASNEVMNVDATTNKAVGGTQDKSEEVMRLDAERRWAFPEER